MLWRLPGRYGRMGAPLPASMVNSLNGQTGALTLWCSPCGRLTLTTGTPVMSSDVAGATTVYYTPCAGHQFVPIYDGTQLVPRDIGGELSQLTTDTTKSPAAVANNSNYDKFVWKDSGTYRCTRGPAWESATSRGTGAGKTELELLQGVYVNKYDITNGPVARRGTYVGMVRSNGTATIDWKLGSSAAGGGEAWLGVDNAYNERWISGAVKDSTSSWSLTSATARAANNSSTMRVSFVDGLQDNSFDIIYGSRVGVFGVNALAYIGVGLNSTTAFSSKMILLTGSALINTGVTATYRSPPLLGFNFVSAMEVSDGTNSAPFVAGASNEGGLTYSVKM